MKKHHVIPYQPYDNMTTSAFAAAVVRNGCFNSLLQVDMFKKIGEFGFVSKIEAALV